MADMAPISPQKNSIIGFIPARSGSKRVKDKNVTPIGGHPLLAYAITSAIASKIFDAVVLSTDSESYADIGRHYGATVPFLRPDTMAADHSIDIQWISYTLDRLQKAGHRYDCFSILRPTNPFRSANTIRRAWQTFLDAKDIDSLRAVEKCTQHPGKMWVIRGGLMTPILPYHHGETPWHSSPYQVLPEIYIQNASLEIAWCQKALQQHSLAGDRIVPFITEEYEGFDINYPYDIELAELLIRSGRAALPTITIPAYTGPRS